MIQGIKIPSPSTESQTERLLLLNMYVYTPLSEQIIGDHAATRNVLE